MTTYLPKKSTERSLTEKLVHVMESDEPMPQANVKLQAAQTILDRIGLSKTDKLDVNIEADNGALFILPAKTVYEVT